MAFSFDELKFARDRGYSDDEIWNIISSENKEIGLAKERGYSLDEVASIESGKPMPSVEAPEPEPIEERGIVRAAGDVGVAFTQGGVRGFRSLTDVFGADNPASTTLRGVEDYVGNLLSAQAKKDQREVSRILTEAQDKGIYDQLIAGVEAFATAPVLTTAGAAGSIAVNLLGGITANAASLGIRGIALGARGMMASQAAIGAAQGAGIIKGEIYDATESYLLEKGMSPEIAKQGASEAQSYGGKNLDSILLGTGLGAAAAMTGVEKVARNVILRQGGIPTTKAITRFVTGTLEEMVPEAAQAGQEQLAKNLALQREGADVPTMRGVVGSAALEGLAGGALGGPTKLLFGKSKGKTPEIIEEEEIDSTSDQVADELEKEPVSPATEMAMKRMQFQSQIDNLTTEIEEDELLLQTIEQTSPDRQKAELALSGKKTALANIISEFNTIPKEELSETITPAAATATPTATKETTIAKIDELNKEFDALDENDTAGQDRVNKAIFAEQNKLAGFTAIEQGIDPQGTTPTREMGLPPSGRRSEFGTFFPDRPILQVFVKATDKALGAIQATGKRAQKLKNAIRTGITSNAGFLAGTNTEVISSEEYGKLTGGKQVAADTGTYRATFFNGKKYLVVPDINQLAGISIEGEQRAASRDAALDQESRAAAKKLEEEMIHLSMFQGIQDEYKNIKKPKFSEQEYIVKRISDIAKEVKRTNPNALPGVSEVYLNQKNRLLDDMTFSQEFMRMVIQRVRTGQITEDLNAIRKAEQEAFSDQDKGNITAWKNSILNALEFVRNSIARYLGKGTSTKEVKKMEDAINNILDEYGIVKGEANYEFKDYSAAEPKGELKAEPIEEAAVTPTKEVRNIEEASQETGVPQEAILSAAQNGEIEAAKVGNDWRFGQKGIDEIKSKLSETITPTEEATGKPAKFPTMPSIEEQTAEKVYGGETGLYDPFAGVQKKRTKAEDPAGRRGTEDQIKNADEHAAEIGGTVLYQDGDISLIRGYSLLGGTPVYIVANKGSRARTDISSYTGNLVAPEQKAQLVDIKNKIEAEDQASFNSKPFITFTDGIAFSNGVPSTIAGVLRGWKSLLNIKANLYVTTYDDAVADKDNFNGPHRVIGSAGLASSKTDGSIRKMPNGDFYIMFRGIPSRTKMLETLAHELGHLHQKEAFENADLETKQMLREEHDKWVKSQTGKTAQELISSLRAVKTAKTNLGAAEGMMAEEMSAYWKSFGEWYADQVSRWAVSAEKPLTIVDKFFSRIAKALRSFYANLTNQGFLPNETFVQYLEKTLKEPARIVSETITPAIETSPNTEVESEVAEIENLSEDATYEQIEEAAPATMVNLKASTKNVAGSFQQFSNILNDSFKSLVRFAQTIWKKIGFITVAIAGASLITSPIFVGSYINLQGPKGRADLRPTGLIKDNQNIFKPYLKKTTVEELAKSLETPAETLDLIRNAINQSQPFVGNVDIDFNSIDQFADSIKPEDFPSGNTKRSYNYNPLLEISANDVKNAAQSLKTLAKDKAKIESRIRQIMGAMEFYTKRKFKDVKIIVRQTSPSEAATFMALGRAGGFPTSEARYNPKENTIELQPQTLISLAEDGVVAISSASNLANELTHNLQYTTNNGQPLGILDIKLSDFDTASTFLVMQMPIYSKNGKLFQTINAESNWADILIGKYFGAKNNIQPKSIESVLAEQPLMQKALQEKETTDFVDSIGYMSGMSSQEIIARAGTTPAIEAKAGLSPAEQQTKQDRFLSTEVRVNKNDQRFSQSKEVSVGPGGIANFVQQANLSEIVSEPSVYHESDLNNIRKIIARISSGLRNIDLWTSNSIDLALGQKGTGYVIELDTKKVNGSIAPSLAAEIQAGLGVAGTEIKVNKTAPSAIKSVIVPNNAGLNALRKTDGFEKLFDFDNATQTERGIRIPAKQKPTPAIIARAGVTPEGEPISKRGQSIMQKITTRMIADLEAQAEMLKPKKNKAYTEYKSRTTNKGKTYNQALISPFSLAANLFTSNSFTEANNALNKIIRGNPDADFFDIAQGLAGTDAAEAQRRYGIDQNERFVLMDMIYSLLPAFRKEVDDSDMKATARDSFRLDALNVEAKLAQNIALAAQSGGQIVGYARVLRKLVGAGMAILTYKRGIIDSMGSLAKATNASFNDVANAIRGDRRKSMDNVFNTKEVFKKAVSMIKMAQRNPEKVRQAIRAEVSKKQNLKTTDILLQFASGLFDTKEDKYANMVLDQTVQNILSIGMNKKEFSIDNVTKFMYQSFATAAKQLGVEQAGVEKPKRGKRSGKYMEMVKAVIGNDNAYKSFLNDLASRMAEKYQSRDAFNADFAELFTALRSNEWADGLREQAIKDTTQFLNYKFADLFTYLGSQRNVNQEAVKQHIRSELQGTGASNELIEKFIQDTDKYLNEETSRILQDKLGFRIDEKTGKVIPKPLLSSKIKEEAEEQFKAIKNLKDISKLSTSDEGNFIEALISRIITEVGMDKEQATELATLISTQMEKAMLAQRSENVDRAIKDAQEILNSNGVKPKTNQRTVLQKLIEMANMGVLDAEGVYEAFRKTHDFPKGFLPYDADFTNTLREWGDRISKLPPGVIRSIEEEKMGRALMEKSKFTIGDILSSYWYFSLLSQVATQGINALSGASNLMANVAVWSLYNPKSFFPMMRAMYHAIEGRKSPAVNSFLYVMRNGLNPSGMQDEKRAKYPKTNVLESATPENTPKIVYYLTNFGDGKINFLPDWMNTALKNVNPRQLMRVLRATDMFLREVAYEAKAAQIGAADFSREGFDMAKRQAESELFSSDATGKQKEQEIIIRANEIYREQRLDETGRAIAEQASLETAFNQQPVGLFGLLANFVNSLLGKYPATKFIIPFTNVVANVTNEFINYTPVFSQIRLIGSKRRGVNDPFTQGSAEKQLEMAIKGGVGMFVMAIPFIIQALTGGDDEDQEERPYIQFYAEGPKDPRQKKIWQQRGGQKYSVRVGNTYFSYLPTPLVIPLAMGAMLQEEIKSMNKKGKKVQSEDIGKLAASVLTAPFSVGFVAVLNQSFLTGLADLLEFKESQNPVEKGTQVVGGILSRMAVPGVFRDINKLYTEDKAIGSGYLSNFLKDFPGSVNFLNKDVNYFGDDAKFPSAVREEGFGKRLASVVGRIVSTEQPDPAFEVMYRNNLTPPSWDASLSWDNGKRMTKEQELQFIREAGPLMRERIVEVSDELDELPIDDAQDLLSTEIRIIRREVKEDLQDRLEIPLDIE